MKDRRDRRDAEEDPKDVEGAMGVIAQQDEDIDMLLACLEKVMADAAVDSAEISSTWVIICSSSLLAASTCSRCSRTGLASGRLVFARGVKPKIALSGVRIS